MNAPRAELDRTWGVEKGAPLSGEPIVHFERSPGRAEVELKDLDSLFDGDVPPTHPHTGPMLNKAVAKFLIDSVREDRRSPTVRVAIQFRGSPLRPKEEEGTRAQMSNFFANEAEMAALEQRVNDAEGLSSLRFAIPVVVVAGLAAGLLINPATLGGPAYLTGIAYIVAIVVSWVMLWDPIEKLLFESYFLRLRIRALHKLATAKIEFGYSSGHSTDPRPTPD